MEDSIYLSTYYMPVSILSRRTYMKDQGHCKVLLFPCHLKSFHNKLRTNDAFRWSPSWRHRSIVLSVVQILGNLLIVPTESNMEETKDTNTTKGRPDDHCNMLEAIEKFWVWKEDTKIKFSSNTWEEQLSISCGLIVKSFYQFLVQFLMSAHYF